ncbi:MAG TPA: hypothetical protein VHO84_12465 [Syntrophorhabdaceae bacterium]|nr:hypothetical protein [Syntrophorhabdaceae bacterium]
MPCANTYSRITIFCLVVFLSFGYSIALASDGWKKVAVTKQNDLWYVDQTIGFSSRGAVISSRALLKFVPGPKSAIGENVKRGLLTDGVNAARFSYFVESVSVDCKKGILSISKIDFFDSEDAIIHASTFELPRNYPVNNGSAYSIISKDLCQIRPDPFASIKYALKTKKPFLYFYP